MLQTRKPMTDEAIQAMAKRNARRLVIVKRVMGESYAHHPAQHVKRLDYVPPFSIQLRSYQAEVIKRIMHRVGSKKPNTWLA